MRKASPEVFILRAPGQGTPIVLAWTKQCQAAPVVFRWMSTRSGHTYHSCTHKHHSKSHLSSSRGRTPGQGTPPWLLGSS